MLIDEAVIVVSSGHGGSGAATFHREKHVPRGGPNGANGGRGGSVVFVADRGKRTLIDFHFAQSFEAESGSDAVGNKSGKDGKDIEIRVPVGTVISDSATGKILADLMSEGSRATVCKGGRGGRGNLHYTTSVRQAPTMSEKGAPSETVSLRLELKMLADVGIIGLPNAGKSTLISSISAAKPRIADYPFTTIEPNLGVVTVDDFSFLVADMPGLIEGASEGKGLGHRFLKHVERARVLVHLVEARPLDESDPLENLELVERELAAYDAELASRPRIIAVSKIDVLDAESLELLLNRFIQAGTNVIAISSVSGHGVVELTRAMAKHVKAADDSAGVPVLTPTPIEVQEDERWTAVVQGDAFVVTGKKPERLVSMSRLDNDESLQYLHRRLERMGILDRLRELGAEEGDTVRIGSVEFSYSERS